MVRSLLVPLTLTLAATLADGKQLPPEILLDQLLLRTGRLIEAEDHVGAHDAIRRMLALQEENGLDLPPEFHFRRAQTVFANGSLIGAKDAVTRYLTVAGREGEFYTDALELLEEVVGVLEKRDAPDCTGQPQGATCWMEISNHPDCYVWNLNVQLVESVTWTGECSAGLAEGRGTLTYEWPPDGLQEVEGTLRFGKVHGATVLTNGDGSTTEGVFVYGKEHGIWVLRFADGTVHEGPFVQGNRHGDWILREADGGVHQGAFVNGERQGDWVLRFADGQIEEGPFLEGKRHGRWVLTFPDGHVDEGQFLEGERHGEWVVRAPGEEPTAVMWIRGVRQEW